MNKAQFEALTPEHRALVEEAYRDGYAAAVQVLESCYIRIGDTVLDEMFISNRNTLVEIVKQGLK
jgi:hypothetical protein